MFPLSIRIANNLVKPVTLMRLAQINDPDELLKDYSEDDLTVEEKFDGWKIQVIKNNGKVSLYSRRGKDLTENFPKIVESLKFLPNGTLIEGELVYWEEKKQQLDKLTSLANSSTEKSKKLAEEMSGVVRFHVFDILWKNNSKLTDKTFAERRKILKSVIKESDRIKITKEYPFSEWQKAINNAVDYGGEGIVIKNKNATYHYKKIDEREPKPSGVMWKYKGGKGKSESDDYVVYDITKGEKGKLKALFGQYYKGKLYHISELSNFSSKVEKEIKDRLKKGNFVIEIGFQERVPGGLRHQKFLRFRDDKSPKNATMNEFHVKYIDKLKKVAFVSNSAIIDPENLIRLVEKIRTKTPNKRKTIPRDYSGLKSLPNVNLEKAYKMIAQLESGNSFAIGDSGTSFGPVQVQLGSFLSALSADPKAQELTNMSPQEMKRLASAWSNSLKKIKKLQGDIWEKVPVDEDAVKRTMKDRRRVVRRKEGTTIRHAPGGKPGIVKIIDGKFVGYALDLNKLKEAGLEITPKVMAELYKITGQYITSAVVRNAIAKLLTKQQAKSIYDKFELTFTKSNVQQNQGLRDLADRAAQRNFTNRAEQVLSDIARYGYDTTDPNAFNAYQLIAIANASGVGRVRQFLRDKKTFGPGHLHYLQRANKLFSKEGISSSFPPKGGIAGFHSNENARVAAVISFASEPTPRHPLGGLAGAIVHTINRYLNMEEIPREEWETLPIALISMRRNPTKLVVVLRVRTMGGLKELLPNKIKGIDIEYFTLPTSRKETVSKEPKRKVDLEFETRPTPIDPIARMPLSIFQRYIYILKKAREELLAMGKNVPDGILKKEVLKRVAKEHNLSKEALEKILGMNIEEFVTKANNKFSLSKRAEKCLEFPGEFFEDIKNGKRNFSIRLFNTPIEKDEIIKAVTYSGADICHLRIITKEIMSIKRIEKAFGTRCAESLEKKFGNNRSFVVIRFEKIDINVADDVDVDVDEKKMSEVLISNGKTLTRGEIKKYYSKPIVRKTIMSRIKEKPVLVYIGIGKNKKILKRNHNNKPIVITNDDLSKSDSPNNYWYWVNRRVLSFHEILGKKVDHGFVDLDIHGNYSLEKAKKYAKKLLPILKKEFNTSPIIYQSGGTGLHIEFKLNKEMFVDALRKQLKEILSKLNENFENVTTGLIKGNGLRTDVSTLHYKGGIRVPGSLGENTGNIKRKLSQKVDDNYGNHNFGVKHMIPPGPEGHSGKEGVFHFPSPQSVAPIPKGWHSAGNLNRKDLFKKIGDGNGR